MVTVRVYVTLKPALLDSAGRTVNQTLHSLGFDEVEDVRIGKLIELKVKSYDEHRVNQMCEKLLANGVIESARHEVIE